MTIETFLDDLGAYLQNNSIGTLGTDIFFNGLEGTPINCIALTPFPGREPYNIISGEINPYQPNLSVLVRNENSNTGYQIAVSIYKLLRNVANQDIGDTHFISISATSPPGFVSRSDSGAFIFSVNFSLIIQ
jgi:hypothetical protein